MTDTRVLLALAALVVVALFYISRGMESALAPFCAVGTAALWVSAAGCFGLLLPGTWVFYGLTVCAGLYLLWQHVLRGKPLPVPGVGFWFFVAASLALVLLLWLRQPMFTAWDEFSTWGTQNKLMKLYNQLYTTAPVGWAWTASQPPALAAISYFFQFFGEGFSEWQNYVATDILQVSAMATLLAGLKKKNWNIAIPLMLAGLMAPYVFTRYRQVPIVASPYLDVMADIPLGLCFAAALCCWYGTGQKRLSAMVPALVGLAMVCLVKDIGMSLALVAAVVMWVDFLVCRGERLPQPQKEPPKLSLLSVIESPAPMAAHQQPSPRRFGRVLRLVLPVGAVALAFVGWAAYLGQAAGVQRLESLGGKADMGMLQMPLAFLAETFSAEKSEVYRHVMGEMPRLFFTGKVNMLGTGVMTVGIILAMLALAWLLTKTPTMRKRCMAFAIVSTLGFIAYFLLIAMTYIYLFRREQAMELIEWERYIYPYYMGWFLAAAHLLGAAASGMATRRAAVGRLALLGISALMFVQTARMIPAIHSILGVHSDEYNERRAFAAYVQELRAPLDPAGKTFMVISNDTGIAYFTYCYEFLPWQLDYSYGGGILATRQHQPNGTTLETEVTAAQWQQHLLETGCTTVFIDNADEHFKELYGSVFSDGMASYEQGITRFYSVQPQDGGVTLVPMPREG